VAGLGRLIAAGAAARLALLLWAAWQDATMAVKYTDIDYEASCRSHCVRLQHHTEAHSPCGSGSLRGTTPAEQLRQRPQLTGSASCVTLLSAARQPRMRCPD